MTCKCGKPAVPGKKKCHGCRKALVRSNDLVKYRFDNMKLWATRLGVPWSYPLSTYRANAAAGLHRLLRRDRSKGFTVKNLEAR